MKRYVIGLVVIAIALAGVAGIAAAGGPGRGPFGHMNDGYGHMSGFAGMNIIADVVGEATGLTPEELYDALDEEGATLSSVITANGGDVETVKAALIEAMRTHLQERAAANPDRVQPMLDNLEAHIDWLLNKTFNGSAFGQGMHFDGGMHSGGWGHCPGFGTSSDS